MNARLHTHPAVYCGRVLVLVACAALLAGASARAAQRHVPTVRDAVRPCAAPNRQAATARGTGDELVVPGQHLPAAPSRQATKPVGPAKCHARASGPPAPAIRRGTGSTKCGIVDELALAVPRWPRHSPAAAPRDPVRGPARVGRCGGRASRPKPAPQSKPSSPPIAATRPSLSVPFPLLAPGASLARTEPLIDAFQIPPFLLPIYQAAGVQYDVPWQILAAINWIETDYGRNLSTSSAGAMGWMQFMPSTWARYGVDMTGDGVNDPYDPIDAIFAAARYLHAAGASSSLPGAIYAYNHATWYVQSVLVRAKLISGYPAALIDALTELMQARFPVAGPVRGYRHPLATGGGTTPRTADRELVFARPGAPAVAVTDGRIVNIGDSQALGRYAILEDGFGNTYTYSGLGRIAHTYAIPKPVTLSPREIAAELALPSTPKPVTPATAGNTTRAWGPAHAQSAPAAPRAVTQPVFASKERLFVYPLRPASYASGGLMQLSVSDPSEYFAGTLTLRAGQYALAALRPGATVLAGTILGRLGPSRPGADSHLTFMINPAGKRAPRIDPQPILRSWELSGRAGIYGTGAKDPLIDVGSRDPAVGQILLMSKQRLRAQVLADPSVRIYRCGRRDIEAGLVDRRVLAAIEYLSVLGLHPTISGLVCGMGQMHASGTSFEISAVDSTPVAGHQGPRSLTALAIRALLGLQGVMRPAEIISLHSYAGQPNTLGLPDHATQVEVDYESSTTLSTLNAREWAALTAQLSRLSEPIFLAGR